MGRPKGINNKDQICTLRLDKKTNKKLEQYCTNNDVIKSEVIRKAIDNLIDSKK